MCNLKTKFLFKELFLPDLAHNLFEYNKCLILKQNDVK